MRKHLKLRAPELLRPVALLAGVRGWAQVMHRGGNGPRIRAHRRVINLASAGEFGLHIPTRARSHMAFHAAYAGVGRLLISGKFRTHDGVAKLPAELHRVGEL